MENPLVSCIIPMYNSENTISDCLESIIEIDYRPIEILVVNDGSKDNSVKVSKIFIEKNKSMGIDFSLINNDKNRGISSAKNKGMQQMKGVYFFFTGSDDIVLPKRISVPLSYLHKNPEVDIVYSDIEIWHELTGSKTKRGFPKGMTNHNAFLHQLKRSYLWSGVLFARSSVKLDFDENLSSAVDYDWYFNQFFDGKNIHLIDSVLVSYRMHSNNTSKKLSESKDNVRKVLHKYDFSNAYETLVNNEKFDNETINFFFAWYYFTIYEFEEALKKLNFVGTNIEKKFLEGVIFVRMKKHSLALESFRSIYEENPAIPECLNNLSVCLILNSKSLDAAKELLTKAIELNSDYLDAKANLQLINNTNFNPKILHLTEKPLRSRLTHIHDYI